MGQYHVPASLDKAEALHAHRMDQGLKLMEWGSNGYGGPTTGMALFMAPGGRWHGDRLVVMGDYGEVGDLPDDAPFAADPAAVYSLGHEDEAPTDRAKMLAGEAFGVTYSEGKLSEVSFDHGRMAELVANPADDPTFGALFVVDTTTGQYLDPQAFGAGRNLPAIALRGCGVMTALAVLLAVSNGRGGGDLDSDSPLVGSWGAHRVVLGQRPTEGEDLSGRVQLVLAEAEGSWLAIEGGWDSVGTVPEWLLAKVGA